MLPLPGTRGAQQWEKNQHKIHLDETPAATLWSPYGITFITETCDEYREEKKLPVIRWITKSLILTR